MSEVEFSKKEYIKEQEGMMHPPDEKIKFDWENWVPTYKWLTATIVAGGTVVAMMLTGDGINTDTEQVMTVGLVVERLVAYFTPRY